MGRRVTLRLAIFLWPSGRLWCFMLLLVLVATFTSGSSVGSLDDVWQREHFTIYFVYLLPMPHFSVPLKTMSLPSASAARFNSIRNAFHPSGVLAGYFFLSKAQMMCLLSDYPVTARISMSWYGGVLSGSAFNKASLLASTITTGQRHYNNRV